MTHVNLGAGAGELGMDVGGDRIGVLLDYMGVMVWRATCSPATSPATSSAASPPAGWRSSGRPNPGGHAGYGRRWLAVGLSLGKLLRVVDEAEELVRAEAGRAGDQGHQGDVGR